MNTQVHSKYVELVEDERTLDAVLRRLQVMGEAVKRIDSDLREEYSEIPWKQIAGLRDVVVHDNDEIKIERIWKIIKDRLPIVLEQLKKIR